MLSDQKENLHEICATWYEKHHPNSATYNSVIMHHWMRSGNTLKKVTVHLGGSPHVSERDFFDWAQLLRLLKEQKTFQALYCVRVCTRHGRWQRLLHLPLALPPPLPPPLPPQAVRPPLPLPRHRSPCVMLPVRVAFRWNVICRQLQRRKRPLTAKR